MEEKLTLSPLSFAFVGDAYMSLVIRRMLLEKGDMPVGKFHKASVKYVSADAQAAVYEALIEKGMLTDEEQEIMHRGRNHAHTETVPFFPPKSVSAPDNKTHR